MKYAIITENDISKWSDKTGTVYHFPKRYLDLLKTGTKVIYYKGRVQDKRFENTRLSNSPHYFGLGQIGQITLDNSSGKQDYFGEIKNFVKFSKPVLFKISDAYVETIPENRLSNYWRDGVREIDDSTYNKIKNLAGINEDGISVYNDDNIISPSLESEFFEGGVKKRYTTTYERDPKAREQAVTIHGYTCMACSLNFEEMYGDWGKGFIHVHHIKPVSTVNGKSSINPRTDLIVLCANCHSMVHRRKDRVLSLEELKNIIKKEA
jgi:predicted HNH restriction endonuclease